jgi:hypothetical protein
MSDIRTRPATDEYRDGWEAIDWSDEEPTADRFPTAPCPCIDNPVPDQDEVCARCEAGEEPAAMTEADYRAVCARSVAFQRALNEPADAGPVLARTDAEPMRKVTEVARGYIGGCGEWLFSCESQEYPGRWCLQSLSPAEEYANGRFRITVEFWPGGE